MNAAQMYRINNILRSLKSSTNLEIKFRDESVIIGGRCSPFQSHQTIEFGEGHHLPKLIWIKNERFSVIVDGNYRNFDIDNSINSLIRIEAVPSFLIRQILPPFYDLKWLRTSS
ncbi:MAG: hypothetical protein ACP5OE_09640, partial [Thermodesulfobium sp.]